MIFLKSLLLGLKKKIWEPIMIVLTVAIAVATFVSALTLRSSVRENTVASYRAFAGECELEASLSEEYSTYYLTADSQLYRTFEKQAENYGTLYAGYLFYASIGKEEGKFAEVYATDSSRLAEYNAVTFVEGGYAKGRTGVVLSAVFAEKIGAQAGDYLTATRYGSDSSLTLLVTGIAEPVGVFRQADALLSEEGASRLLSLADSVKVYNRFYLDLSDQKLAALGLDEEAVKGKLSQTCPFFELSSPVADGEIEVALSYQSTLLFVIAVIVAALGVILIYTAVSLVMKNRVAAASLFKSVGATSGALTLYLLAEILLYALVGSLLGLGLSYGVGALFGYLTGSVVSFSVGILSAFLGVAFGILLALLSALIPVLRLALSPLYDLLHEASPVKPVKALPAAIAGGVFVALFLGTAFASVGAAFVLGVFAFFALLAALFTLVPLAVKGFSALLARLTRPFPKAGKLYVASSGAKHDRHAHSGARLLAISVMAVVSVAVLIGEANRQLSSFNDLFRADIIVSASVDTLPSVAAESAEVEGVTGSYLAYVASHCALEGNSSNTVSFFAAHGQEFEKAFCVSDLGVEVSSFTGKGERTAAIGGGLALKMGLSVGDTFTLTLDDKKVDFVIGALIDTPLTVVFSDLTGLGISPNVCLVEGGADAYSRLAEKYSLEGAVCTSEDAFGYATDLAVAYMKVFTLFEVLVCIFALAGYMNTAVAAYRDRKRERELLSAAGASPSDLRTIVILENAVVVISALLIGTIFSFAVLYIVQNMLKTLGLYFTLLG